MSWGSSSVKWSTAQSLTASRLSARRVLSRQAARRSRIRSFEPTSAMSSMNAFGTAAIAFCPPLVITDDEIDECLAASRAALMSAGAPG